MSYYLERKFLSIFQDTWWLISSTNYNNLCVTILTYFCYAFPLRHIIRHKNRQEKYVVKKRSKKCDTLILHRQKTVTKIRSWSPDKLKVV